MQNNETIKLAMMIDRSKSIIKKLSDHADIYEILLIITQRDELILDLIEQSSGDNQRDIIRKVLQLRDQEYIALTPYRHEFEELKQALIKINHHKQYITADINDVV